MRKCSVEISALTNYWKDGTVLRVGLCDSVASMIVDILAKQVELFYQSGDEGRVVVPNESCTTQRCIYFTPKGWFCVIDHFCIEVLCTDGLIIVDIPMKEYTTRDKRYWYFKKNDNFQLCFIETRGDLMEAYEITRKDATRIVDKIRGDYINYEGYRVWMSKEELYCCISGTEYVNPNQLKLAI